MKKIFTLLFALGSFALVQAQPGSRDRDQRQPEAPVTRPYDQRDADNGYQNQRDIVVNRDNSYGNDNRYDNRYDNRFSMERRKDMEIARVNRTYEFKMQQVRNSFFMGRFEKQRQLRFLEAQRQQDIRMIIMKYKRNGGRYDDRRDDGRGYNDRDNSRSHY
ncbi:MAG: hypothetical protein ABIT05_13460 [Chitinophagaceae bacterium]